MRDRTKLDELIERAKSIPFTDEMRRAQAESYARSLVVTPEENARRVAVYEANKHKGPAAWLWRGEGPPPRRWTAPDGTIVYRTREDTD